MAYVPAHTFLGELGLSHRLQGDTGFGECELRPELCVPDTRIARVSVLGTFADIVAGSLANVATAPRVCMTVDLAVRLLGPPRDGPVEVTSRVLKAGRSLTVTESWFRERGVAGREPEPFAVAHLSFMASPRPQDVVEVPPGYAAVRRPYSLAEPLADAVGCRSSEPGVAEVDRGPYVLNPAGTLQGGIVALVAELAAESAAARPGGTVVTDLEVRYLSAVRAGPARATAAVLRADDRGDVVRVEVRDLGNDGRLTALAVARTRPAALAARGG